MRGLAVISLWLISAVLVWADPSEAAEVSWGALTNQSKANQLVLKKLPEPAVRDRLLPGIVYSNLIKLPFPKLPAKAVAKTVPLVAKSVVAVVTVTSTQSNQPNLVVAPSQSANPAVTNPKLVATQAVVAAAVTPPALKSAVQPVVSQTVVTQPIIQSTANQTVSKKPETASAVNLTSVNNSKTVETVVDQAYHSEQLASLGQNMSAVFPGKGWLYLGTGTVNDGVVYLQSTTEPAGERFSFRLEKAGNKLLQFQKQDFSHGTLERREILVKVGPAVAMSDTPKNNPSPSSKPIAQATIKNQATSSSSTGTKGYQPSASDPSVSVLPTAYKPDVSDDANTVTVPATAADIFKLAQDRDRAGQAAEAVALYDKLTKDFPDFAQMDQVIYRQAAALETWPNNQRLKEAYDLYLKLQKDFPYSDLVDQSRQRTRWLDRNFFRIR